MIERKKCLFSLTAFKSEEREDLEIERLIRESIILMLTKIKLGSEDQKLLINSKNKELEEARKKTPIELERT